MHTLTGFNGVFQQISKDHAQVGAGKRELIRKRNGEGSIDPCGFRILLVVAEKRVESQILAEDGLAFWNVGGIILQISL